MTLLFFLRSPAGNTDTGQSPDTGIPWDYDETEDARKRRDKEQEKAERKAKRLAKKKWDAAMRGAVETETRRRRKRKDEEMLLMLFLHEFEGYDD
jgi:hypothetical protein